MPVRTGTEFLGEAIKVYPEARKVLLTAYADTQAAITSINTLGLDGRVGKAQPGIERPYTAGLGGRFAWMKMDKNSRQSGKKRRAQVVKKITCH
jgi:hypothetical protein